MKIYFSHGKESGPWGSKIERLAAVARRRGCAVASIDYSAMGDPDQRVAHLVDTLASERDRFCLVGSSMGGYVSLVASEQVCAKGLFLLAPALFMPGYARQDYDAPPVPLEIVHGWSDVVIPPEHSIRFARSADCTLHLISGDHRLNDSIVQVAALFSGFLDSVLAASAA